MTHRTDTNPPTRIETATAATLNAMCDAAALNYREHGLEIQRIDEPGFRRILALYFHHKTLADWCRDLGIPDATDPADKPTHGGEA